jgi:hypothetical protein
MRRPNLNKEILSEELEKFKLLVSYNYYIDSKGINESYPIITNEDDRPEDPKYSDKDIILGMAEAEEDTTDDFEGDIDDIVSDISGETPSGEDDTEELDLDVDLDVDTEDDTDMELDTELDADIDSDEVEIDVTELVKGSEAAKESADLANTKIGELMGMVSKLESQISAMSAISDKIDKLEGEIEKRNPTPKEKLEMRSLDSYPYNIKLTDFWDDKEGNYEANSETTKQPKEYVLTKDDIDTSYSDSSIKKTFTDQQ